MRLANFACLCGPWHLCILSYFCVPWYAFAYLRIFADLGVPWHAFAYFRTFAYLGVPAYFCIPSYLCIPWHCLNILLAESTKGTPGGAFFKLLLASSLLIYIPMLCLPSIHAFFRDPPLRQKSIREIHGTSVNTIAMSFNMSKTQRSTANPSMPRTTHRAHREHREHREQCGRCTCSLV